jgi:hypothetical protein
MRSAALAEYTVDMRMMSYCSLLRCGLIVSDKSSWQLCLFYITMRPYHADFCLDFDMSLAGVCERLAYEANNVFLMT